MVKFSNNEKIYPPVKKFFVPLQKSNPLCALKTDQLKKTDLDPTDFDRNL